jgi:cytochrome c oxidase assembly factor CtaG
VNVLPIVALLSVAALVYDGWRRSRWSRYEWSGLVGAALLFVATGTPLAMNAMAHLPEHMVLHIVTMFLAPAAMVYGSMGRRWWFAVPVRTRRPLLRTWYRLFRPLRRRPNVQLVIAAVLINLVMVASHTPRIFDAVMATPTLYHVIVEPAFFVSGWMFFSSMLGAPPRRPRAKLRVQFAALVVTMAEMLFLAMAMSIFTASAWYKMTDSAMGMAMPISFHDQQLAAAILWVCGDVWAVPLLIVLVRRVIIRDGGIFEVLNRYSADGSER